ncbi:MAG: GNAT family N-acetyltransferase [Gemmatimonadetes bacterium]|jgi:ribosomal-protein-alanine N-acetyltransferase|nr:GNAT family N-acetyltransferase [Gemmatimonadota bacterium]
MTVPTEIPLSGALLRPWRASDAASLAQHANDDEVWRNMRDRFPHPYTLKDAREWLAFAMTLPAGTNFAIDVDGAAVGGISFEPLGDVFRVGAEVGYWLGRRYWGRGIATEGVRALTAHAFRHFDFVRLQASVFSWNPASARVLEKAGYTLEATNRRAMIKDGKVGDRWLYVKLR